MSIEPIVNLDLRDAIAYRFFMENVKEVIASAGEKEESSIHESVILLAESSFRIADIFCGVRQHLNASPETKND